ncbi:YtxH domain-containing protein [Chloroflexota bacterium]
MTNRDSGKGFAIGFLVGTAIGLAVGFLYAPRPGVETRGMLKEKVAGVTAKVKEAAAEVKQKAQEKLRGEQE